MDANFTQPRAYIERKVGEHGAEARAGFTDLARESDMHTHGSRGAWPESGTVGGESLC
jgi:hypothetical protein